MKAFDATARAGSMTAAAKLLDLQQPTISAHIQRLENEYGVELFLRQGRRLELTTFGRTLLDYTRRAFSGEEDAHALLAAAKNRFVGRLVIHAIGPYNVVPVLKAFGSRHPQVEVSVRVGDSRSITEKLLDYQGDVGVVLNHAEHPELHCMPYRSQRLVVFANREHALARCGEIVLKDLQSQRFVIREEGSTTRRVFESELIARNINIQVALEMGSREAVREAVAQGIGLGVVAETAYVPDPRLVKLKILDTAMATHVDFICRRERQNAPLIAADFGDGDQAFRRT
ncbi:LysR family transcriptional regulator [Burkholderia contaminans]|uniref:LysR substrate-binding domain-containing protein n=1 Tax=Burkholderia contaminans TaxID=488447 RepID=UPI001C96564A|nr:LysR substrate-binding domain-containing protein [Burkholderia contaminans]MBY4884889.1 LysR family transcriptional regulator [Burkholderia contaminans]